MDDEVNTFCRRNTDLEEPSAPVTLIRSFRRIQISSYIDEVVRERRIAGA